MVYYLVSDFFANATSKFTFVVQSKIFHQFLEGTIIHAQLRWNSNDSGTIIRSKFKVRSVFNTLVYDQITAKLIAFPSASTVLCVKW